VAKYSIVLPVRNGGEYFKLCVQSILSQTFVDFNLEILDNCSQDGTLQWLESLSDSRIRVYPSERPLAIEENWQRIVTIPKNEFMSFIGHDDLLDENFLTEMEQLMTEHPKASVYQVHFRYIDSHGNLIRSCKPMKRVQTAPECLTDFLNNKYELSIGHVVRSTDYNAVGGIPKYPNLLFADLELWIRLIEKSYRATSNVECCSYRVHAVSTSKSSSTLHYVNAFFKLLDFFSELSVRDNRYTLIFSNHSLIFFKTYCKSLAHHLLRIPKGQRGDMTVSNFLGRYTKAVEKIMRNNSDQLDKALSIKLAKWIDSNSLTRSLFLVFKKIYPKPVLD
jgi:glycosyltransferase involved in cell wall biosynthesis